MSETVAIRPAQGGDAPDIARIGVQTWRDAYAGLIPDDYLLGMTAARQAARWDAAIRRPGAGEAVLVAEAFDFQGPTGGPRVVGFGSCGRSRAGPMRGEVFTLYIGNDWQNRGIGRRLMFGLFQALERREMGDAAIWVLSGNPARFFYEAMGGARVAKRKERFAGVLLDETAYGWPDLRAWLAEPTRRV